MHKLPQDFAFPLGLGTKKTQVLHNNVAGSVDGVLGGKQTAGSGQNHHHQHNNNNNTNLRNNQNNQIHSSMADIRGDGRGSGETQQGSDAGTDDMSPRAPCQDLDTINL